MAKNKSEEEKVRKNLAFASGMRGAEKEPQGLVVRDKPDGDADDEPQPGPKRNKQVSSKRKATPYTSGMRGREAEPGAED